MCVGFTLFIILVSTSCIYFSDKTLKKKTPSPVEEDTANMTVLTALRTQNEPTASNKMAKHTKFATLANGQFEMFT